jgi:hypothetical protein
MCGRRLFYIRVSCGTPRQWSGMHIPREGPREEERWKYYKKQIFTGDSEGERDGEAGER